MRLPIAASVQQQQLLPAGSQAAAEQLPAESLPVVTSLVKISNSIQK